MLHQGRVVVVTGASRGIGRAMALAFAREGARVVLVARQETDPRLATTVFDVAHEVQSLGSPALPLELDLRKGRSPQRLAATTLAEFGRIDVLVNNAAVQVRGPAAGIPMRAWRLLLDVNLLAPLRCIRAVLPAMRDAGGGHIINVSSVAATGSYPGVVPYGTTKAALERLSLGLAAELREDRIAVTVLKPRGTVATPGVLVLRGGQLPPDADPPDFMAEAAVLLAAQPPETCSGHSYTEEEALRAFGREDLARRMPR